MTTQLNSAVVHQEPGGSLVDLGTVMNVGGTMFCAVCNADRHNNNITWIDLYVVAAGQGFPAAPTYKITPQHKIDSVALTHTIHDLVVTLTTHALVNNPDGSRNIHVEQKVISNIFG